MQDTADNGNYVFEAGYENGEAFVNTFSGWQSNPVSSNGLKCAALLGSTNVKLNGPIIRISQPLLRGVFAEVACSGTNRAYIVEYQQYHKLGGAIETYIEYVS